MYSFSVLTVSDSCSTGKNEDISGKNIKSVLVEKDWNLIDYVIVPDVTQKIKFVLEDMLSRSPQIILTTGGTGLSPRDVTPEATLQIIEKEVPGISEAIRAYGMKSTPFAMLSRGISGICGKTLIINLPGSPKAVSEILPVLLKVIPHALDKVGGDMTPCAAKAKYKISSTTI